MPKVVLTDGLARKYTGGEKMLDIDAGNVRGIIKALDACFPGIGEALGAGISVAIDGEIYQDAFLETVGPDSEICFLPRIAGG